MLDKIFVHNWMALPATTRARLRELLNIPKTGQVEVSTTGGNDSVLVSDGVSANDLNVVTIELLKEFTQSKETEFPRLWVLAVKKADETLSEVGKQLVVEKPVSTGDNGALEIKDEKSDKKKSKV